MPVPSARSVYAAIMGDLVDSEGSVSVEQLHGTFNAAVDKQNQRYENGLASPLTITLGDEFQGLATSLASAVPIMQSLRLQLMCDGRECRFAVGVVTLETAINPDRAWNMMGPGLARTRAKLNEKRDNTLYRFAFPDQPVIVSMLEALSAGLTAIERRWTKRQLHDITALLSGDRPSEIARRRNVSAHSVYKVRNSGEFDLYAMQWQAISDALTHLDGMYEMP